MIKKRLSRLSIGLLIVLVGVYALFGFEWPLPGWLERKINAKFKQQLLEVRYEKARFDFLGNIRLSGIHGHYQGLMEFKAAQALLRPFALGGVEVIVSQAEAHTGFLQLPIPEKIEFSGRVQLRTNGWRLRSMRLKAGSLVMIINGQFLMPQKLGAAVVAGVTNVDVENKKKMDKLLSGFLAELCMDKKLWVAEVTLNPQKSLLTLSGSNFSLGEYALTSPVVRVWYPLNSLSISAEELQTPFGHVRGPGMYYSADEGNLWRGMAEEMIAYKTRILAPSVSARWILGEKPDLNEVKDVYIGARLPQRNYKNGWVLLDELSIKPLSVRLQGQLPPRFLNNYGLKFESTKGVRFFANYSKNILGFRALSGAGKFYGMDFDGLRAHGSLSAKGAKIDDFEMAVDESMAQGSLEYNFESREARYLLKGSADPMIIPWFGDWWQKSFEPFGKIRPNFALALDVVPEKPVIACGVAVARRHNFRQVELNRTFVAIDSREQKTKLDFYTRSSDETQELKGQISFDPAMKVEMSGRVDPIALLRAVTWDEKKNKTAAGKTGMSGWEDLKFTAPAKLKVDYKKDDFTIDLDADAPVKFHAIEFAYLKAVIHGGEKEVRLDPIDFGFAEGRGGASARINTDKTGSGSFWVREAKLGEWPLLGPLSQLLKSKIFAFATLKLHSADGSIIFKPDSVNIPDLNLWGNEHAASASGVIDTKNKTMDFSVKLKTLGGDKAPLGVLAPIVQPLTSVLEARLKGPLDKPQWGLQLSAPRL